MLALVVLLGLAIVLPASADGPVIFTKAAPTNDDVDASVCGFPIDVVDTGTVTFKVWYDESGTAVREMDVYGQAAQTYLANGKSLVSRVSGPIHATLVTLNPDGTSVWDLVITGVTRLVTVRGAGFADGFAGRAVVRVTFDTSDASGSWVDVDWSTFNYKGMWGDNLGAFCAALAP
jgi:hypothetical protein